MESGPVDLTGSCRARSGNQAEGPHHRPGSSGRKHYKQKRETKLLDRIKIESNKKAFIYFIKLVKIKKVKMQRQAIKK